MNITKILKTIKPTDKWSDLNDEQKAVFEDKKFQKAITLSSSKKCFFCKKKFDKPLYSHGWNGEFLFHIHSTHGFSPEVLLYMIRKEVDEKE